MAQNKRPKRPAVYVVHPVTPEQKIELRREYPGHKVVDAKFAPNGEKVVDLTPKPKAKAKPKAKPAEKAAEKAD